MQNEDPSAQCWLASHRPEQQSALPAQVFPAVLQLAFNGVQVLSAPQVPLQHESSLAHAARSETHCAAEHFSATQLTEQQSVPTLHASPDAAQVVVVDTQPDAGSQTPEQHSEPL